MIILAIETSCDDTSVAVLNISGKKTPKFKILSNIISSQVKIHEKWGGVFPSLAKREHEKNLPLVFKEALKEAGNPKIDLIGVTVGPGLEPCLWVGINFAKEMAKKLKVSLVPVNHIEAHILANFIREKKEKKIFPAISLIVSGGHTQLILIKDFGQYQILGETRDDAAGECFDKVARILGLGYPGGPIISKIAKMKTPRISLPIKLPRPMMAHKNYDFSFSGLKTAVLYDFKKRPKSVSKSPTYIQKMCVEAQQAIIDVLIHKTIKTIKDFKAKSLILGGGVTANEELRKQFKSKIKKDNLKVNFLVPDQILCTDNAVMAAIAAYYHRTKNDLRSVKDIEADANLRL
ncbi:MAG: tRNA (adenosine(37)-N6)-threonylcarbamoyltransferase complex transferase subunit TsaD [Patescibacteria group bacterium]